MSVSAGGDDDKYSLPHKLSSKTPFLSLKLYVVIAILLTCAALVSVLVCLCLCLSKKKSMKRKMRVKHSSGSIPLVSKEIVEIRDLGRKENCGKQEGKFGKESEIVVVVDDNAEVGKKNNKKKKSSGEVVEEEEERDDVSAGKSSDVSTDIGWGRWYSLRELDMATRGFAEENVIGEGGYGIVYKGVLPDGSVVAVKNLLNNKGQAEKEFKVEVEAIGKVKHKNLVGLIGYCAEGAQRMLVYEYVDNGNLEQWLHGDVGPV
ncbi:hypothetical protein ACOSP7_005521 [Xanthoceras sorbifolium]